MDGYILNQRMKMLKFKTPKQINLENEYKKEKRLNEIINVCLENEFKQITLNEEDFDIFSNPTLTIKVYNNEGDIIEHDTTYSFIEELNKAGWNISIKKEIKEVNVCD